MTSVLVGVLGAICASTSFGLDMSENPPPYPTSIILCNEITSQCPAPPSAWS